MGSKMLTTVLAYLVGPLYRLVPKVVRRLFAGRPVRIDGQQLDLDMHVLMRLQALGGETAMTVAELPQIRAQLTFASAMGAGRPLRGVGTRAVTLDGALPARLYTPDDLPAGSPLLVFYHGGGFALGGLDSHDAPCRALALRAGVRVLSVDYRLAPENPFPTAVDDCLAAYHYARAHAAELGADPDAVAVGGDSAGGNLSLVVGMLADPDFVLAIYPATNPVPPAPSRSRFGAGFMLTTEDITFYSDSYCPPEQRTDPRYAPALAEDVSGMPPTHIVTGGFDPLRDEGEDFAARLADAGVPVALRRHAGLVHGFINMTGFSSTAADAVTEMAGALRIGLAMHRRRSHVA